MLRKTGSSWLWLGFFLLLPLSAATASPSSSSAISVSVSVHNDAGAPVDVLVEAENIATRVFEQAGVNVKRINCPVVAPASLDAVLCRKAIFPTHFQQRIVPPHPGLSESSFGVSYLSSEGLLQLRFLPTGRRTTPRQGTNAAGVAWPRHGTRDRAPLIGNQFTLHFRNHARALVRSGTRQRQQGRAPVHIGASASDDGAAAGK